MSSGSQMLNPPFLVFQCPRATLWPATKKRLGSNTNFDASVCCSQYPSTNCFNISCVSVDLIDFEALTLTNFPEQFLQSKEGHSRHCEHLIKYEYSLGFALTYS
jgi:hypothetical protein